MSTDPRELVKNRNEMVSEMKEEYGYIFCQRCDTSNSRKFHCHHIVFRSERPKHPKLHSKENLTIVCEECHEEYHKRKFEARKAIINERGLQNIFNHLENELNA